MLTCLKDKHAFKHIEEMKAKLSDKPLPALLKAMLQVDPPCHAHALYHAHAHAHALLQVDPAERLTLTLSP